MATQNELKAAQYIHRGDNGHRIEGLGQCGFLPCNYSKIIDNTDSGGDCYRYCTKLNQRVSEYDSCKFHCEDESAALLQEFAKAGMGLYGGTSPVQTTKPSNPKKKGKFFSAFLTVVVLGVIVYLCFR